MLLRCQAFVTATVPVLTTTSLFQCSQRDCKQTFFLFEELCQHQTLTHSISVTTPQSVTFSPGNRVVERHGGFSGSAVINSSNTFNSRSFDFRQSSTEYRQPQFQPGGGHAGSSNFSNMSLPPHQQFNSERGYRGGLFNHGSRPNSQYQHTPH